MIKTIKFNDVTVEVNWQSSKMRKKIIEIFDSAQKECEAVESSLDELQLMERVESIYHDAFSSLFGKEKCDELFPENSGIDSYFEFIDLMLQLKSEQDKSIDDYTKKFANIANMK